MQTLVDTDPFPSQPRKDRTVQAWLCIPMIHSTKEARQEEHLGFKASWVYKASAKQNQPTQ